MEAFLHNGTLAILAMAVALLVDAVWGEPPERWHPVVWIGRFLGWAGSWAAPASQQITPSMDARAFARGALAWMAGAVVVTGLAWGAAVLLARLPVWAHVLCLGLLLKPLMAWRMLREEVMAVEIALSDSLHAGRERLGWLCSREVHALDAEQVRETAIETLAENLNDSVIAPLFWFAVAGLPGAALYRFANTADAMWGYPGDRAGRRWSWAGKWAARADDVLSWVPARMTAVLLVLAAGRLWLPRLRSEAVRTPSPNGGWPMGAMALLLGVRLGKPDVYMLHGAGRKVLPEDTVSACHLAMRAVAPGLLVCGLLAGMAHA